MKIYSAKDENHNDLYLMTDRSTDYPCWVKSPHGPSETVSIKTTHEIVSCFRSSAGLYYKRDIIPSTLKIIEMVPQIVENIDIKLNTEYEEQHNKFKSLSEKDIAFIKKHL